MEPQQRVADAGGVERLGFGRSAVVSTVAATVAAAAETSNLQRIAKLSESSDAFSLLSQEFADEERSIALLLGQLDEIDALLKDES